MLSVAQLQAQIPNRGCGTEVPDAQYDALFQQKVLDYLNQTTATNRTQSTFQIPVIIHVIHGGEAIGTFPNLEQLQINSQINVLNDDYSGIGLNSGTYPSTAFQTYATNTVIAATSKDGTGRIGISNTGISFCLALKDSVGNFLPEPGIERKNWNTISGASNPTTYTTTGSFMTFMNTVVKPATIWSPDKYLNIWITDVNPSTGLLGFAVFPPLSGLPGITGAGTSTTDGLWCWAKTFGSQNIFGAGVYNAPYNYGRTATHELSHYFGIKHTWGDGSCLTDYCNDTPGQQGPTSNLQTYPYLPNNCTSTVPPTGPEGIMFMNFADYTPDAGMYMFTDEQKIRMQTAMVNSPYRKFLGTHGFCNAVTSPTANFAISASVICQGQSVSLTDLSTPAGSITSWNYNCAAASPPSSTLQNPTFTFNFPGTHTITLTVTAGGSNSTATKTIQVNPAPTILSNVNATTLCAGSILTFSNSGGSTYTLNPSALTGSVINVFPSIAGTTIYTVSGTNSFGCINSKTISITVLPVPNVFVTPSNTTICSGQSLVLTATGANTYSWNTGSTSSLISVTPTITTTYTVTGTNTSGCQKSATSVVNVASTPIVSINSPSTNVCFGYTMTLTASGATNYQWFNGTTANTITVQPLSNVTYTVIGNNGGACADTAYLPITILPLPSVSASVNNTLACVGQTVNLTASGTAINYLWQPNNLFGPNQIVQVFTPTTFTVYGQGSNGCAFFSTVFVNVQPGTSIIPVSTPSSVCTGDSAVLSVIGGSVPSWSNNAIPNTSVVKPISNTSYTVNAVDLNGCVGDIVFNVGINTDCDIITYNGFTPNGDGINDFWIIDNIEKHPNNKVYIYNRWGNKIFETSQYNNASNKWDGKLNGKAVTSGTYFYMIMDNNEKLFKKGWIEITN